MAEIRPFRGIHYNQSVVGDLAGVICPPYDIISPQMQQELYQRSEYNFVRLEFTQGLPGEAPADKYARASATLEEWLAKGVLEVDEKPPIYLHDHHFVLRGRQYQRWGIIAVVRLKEWGEGAVRPHEGTLAAPKSDRLSLMWALQANTSPILALFEGGQAASSLSAQDRIEPMFDMKNANGERHRLWPISNTGAIKQISGSLAGQPLYIADGHHRYESALTYRRERRACSPQASADEPFDFVMMELVDFADPGLVILPTHRLIRGMPESALNELPARLEKLFEIKELQLNMSHIWQQVDGLGEDELIMFGPASERPCVLKLRDFTMVSQMMPYFHSELYKRLNVSIVDHVILEGILGLTRDKEAASLVYSHDAQDAVSKVSSREYQLAFLLSPIRAGAIKAIADVGDRMPRKSTYFYPKLPSGLVFYRLK